MKAKCPHCDKSFSVPLEFAGETVKCPKCKNDVEAPPLPTSPIIGYILACIVSAALAGTIGFSCGALLTRTNREQTTAKILAIQTEANAEIEKARDEMFEAQAELEQLEKDLESPSSNVSYQYIRGFMRSVTEAQWKEYARGLKGKIIKWNGWVENVNETFSGGYELLVDMDPPESITSIDVKFNIHKSVAMRLKKDQKINFQGMIKSITNMFGSCIIELENANVY